MKKVSVSLPCYNEEGNVRALAQAIIQQFEDNLPEYDYELQFIDNCSTDGTRQILEKLCQENPQHIKAIFNSRNFGPNASSYYGLMQTTGDCSIPMATDFQTPPELIPTLVREWEKGAKVVCAIRTGSKENWGMRTIRKLYYKLIDKFSDIEQLSGFTGFGCYDRKFLDICRKIDDPLPSFRGMVAEFGYKMVLVPFEQPKRKSGKSKNNFYTLFDIAMKNFTMYTKVGLRCATLLGFLIAGLSVLIGLVYLVMKCIWWSSFQAGIAPVLIGMFFLGAVQLVFIGFLGEYVMNINLRIMKRPLVIEERRLNFEEQEQREEKA